MITSTKDFLKMNLDELFDRFVTFAISDKNAIEVIEALKKTSRYSEEPDFRVMVDYAQILSESANHFISKEKFAKRIIKCIDIIDRATNLELWTVAANAWNSLAVTYQLKMMFEKALECYSHAIRIESQHGNYKISPLVYTNIVGIFMQIEEFDRALFFIERAEKILEENKQTIPRYVMRYVSICIWHIRIRISKKQIDRDVLKMYFDRILAVNPEELSLEVQSLALSAKFYYGFFFFTKEEHDKVLDEIRASSSLEYYVLFVQQSIELAKLHGRDYERYVERLLQIETEEEFLHPRINLYTFEALMEYYEAYGNREKLENARVKYIKNSNLNLEQLSQQQNEAINTIEQLLMSQDFKKNNEIENIEFKKIADEAIKTKRELERAYKRIEIIGELGRKITATTDLNELVDMIYQIIKQHLSVDCFVLLYADDDRKVLRSVAAYRKDEVQPTFEIDLNDKHNILSQCYDSKCILQYHTKVNMIDQYPFEHGCDEQTKSSCVLMPLIVADKVIGVFSLQSELENAYEGEHFKFLKEIEPYLSIALNNGVRSWMMEKESEHRRKIQLELEEANVILSKISSMDGLTQVSSRRDFEEKFKQMLGTAQQMGESICVLMMDIDYFKLYNDNYGHLQGDEVLKQVAKVFREHLNSVDGLCARFGGEEFIGASLNLDANEALALAERICRDIQGLNIEHRANPWRVVTVSIGICVSEKPDESMRSKLMRTADECLYRAKEQGKNLCVIGQIHKM